MKEKIAMWIAWHLPKQVVMWCYIRVAAYATTHEYADKTPYEVNIAQALEVWK